MKKILICLLFFVFANVNALVYDFNNTSNKDLIVFMYPTDSSKPIGQFKISPNQKSTTYYNTSTGGGGINVYSWGVKKIHVMDPISRQSFTSDLSKKYQRENLKINFYAYDSIEQAQVAGHPKQVWFNFTIKK